MNPNFLQRRIYDRGESLGKLLARPFYTFASLEAAGGILILLAAACALIWVNSGLTELYEHLWNIHASIGVNGFVLDHSLHFWINDGLMAVFFFVVGLEIKREILVGELTSFRKAALPVAGAVGGMVVPALIYLAFNQADQPVKGWGIPMATDIAFVMGAITLLGPRAPHSLGVFLAALAIADDLGAVLVIALFYTANISADHLALAAILLLIMVVVNFLGFRRPLPYVILGAFVWLFVHLSGVHSTVAGVLVAMTFPARSRYDTDTFLGRVRRVLEDFECGGKCGYSMYTNEEHQSAVRKLESLCVSVDPPLQRVEHLMHPWAVFLIMPLFALANAGVTLDWSTIKDSFQNPISLGIMLGLFFGKQIGVTLAAWLAARSGLAELPRGVTFRQIYGGSVLCGIGFTMSLFIASLAFDASSLLDTAKVGIFVGSLVSFVVGYVILYVGSSGAWGTSDSK
ncbi:MAG: Na+/H+ antiporter NhaA [Desulfomonile tiedjei]|uniref:Na(+)/H(+) antiporter NhaA n=1 Tax=Desulfomonile tiedjei TaxID=2358 RepID=A0A9D6Z3H7_9BACT|nr:Na+/H+ antiporter NhaA [Desulfomonile tiedjei]